MRVPFPLYKNQLEFYTKMFRKCKKAKNMYCFQIEVMSHQRSQVVKRNGFRGRSGSLW